MSHYQSEWGQIVIRREQARAELPPTFDYSWKGPDKAILSLYTLPYDIDRTRLLKTRKFSVGPYPLRVVDYEPWSGNLICIRDRHFAWWRAQTYRIRSGLKWFSARMIATLYIWGLAKYEPAINSQWRDVSAIASIWRFWRRLRKRL